VHSAAFEDKKVRRSKTHLEEVIAFDKAPNPFQVNGFPDRTILTGSSKYCLHLMDEVASSIYRREVLIFGRQALVEFNPTIVGEKSPYRRYPDTPKCDPTVRIF
jgi:hypothetical protein